MNSSRRLAAGRLAAGRLAAVCAVAALIGLAPAPVAAQTYPSQPITIYVPTPPGGIADIISRMFAAGLQKRTGATVVVEGKTGAAGILAADAVAKANPDGYTLYAGYHATQSMLQHFERKLPFDPEKDFAPISLVVDGRNLLVVSPSLGVNSVAELVALLKARPGVYSFASAGMGTVGHLLGEQFQLLTGTKLNHVPYRGAAPAAQDVLAGHVPIFFDLLGLALENVRAGKFKALGYLGSERAPQLPDVPTMKELGYPEFEGGAWFGFLAPAKTPRRVVEWLNRQATEIFSSPENRDVFVKQGMSVPLGPPEAFAAYIAAESKRWGDVIRRSGVKLE